MKKGFLLEERLTILNLSMTTEEQKEIVNAVMTLVAALAIHVIQMQPALRYMNADYSGRQLAKENANNQTEF